MSRLTMLKPADGVQGVKTLWMETVKQAGANPARPLCWALALAAALINAQLWPKAPLLRPAGTFSPTRTPIMPRWKRAVGCHQCSHLAQGFGGATTCLGVCIEQLPTHVACLPVAVNVSCHVTRRASAEV